MKTSNDVFTALKDAFAGDDIEKYIAIFGGNTGTSYEFFNDLVSGLTLDEKKEVAIFTGGFNERWKCDSEQYLLPEMGEDYWDFADDNDL